MYVYKLKVKHLQSILYKTMKFLQKEKKSRNVGLNRFSGFIIMRAKRKKLLDVDRLFFAICYAFYEIYHIV